MPAIPYPPLLYDEFFENSKERIIGKAEGLADDPKTYALADEFFENSLKYCTKSGAFCYTGMYAVPRAKKRDFFAGPANNGSPGVLCRGFPE